MKVIPISLRRFRKVKFLYNNNLVQYSLMRYNIKIVKGKITNFRETNIDIHIYCT